MIEINKIYCGNTLDVLKTFPDNFIQCCVTSPPYYGLRDYGIDNQIGLEKTPEQYVENLVKIFQEVKRVLKEDGTLWLNLGDSYNGSGGPGSQYDTKASKGYKGEFTKFENPNKNIEGLKPKDLIGIPWAVAFALRYDGWYLRSDIIWCLSGGAYVYAKTQKGVLPMMIRDINRLNPKTVKLWNGEKWTQLLGISKSSRQGNEIEITLRSGERISCTPTHKFPTNRGLLEVSTLKIGDIIKNCQLPDVDNPRDCSIDEDAAWFAGLYLAEGSKSGDTIQIAGHAKEAERWERVQKIAIKFGGSATKTVTGNNMSIRIYGKVLTAILDELISGHIASNKCFSPSVWKYSNHFIASLLDGYLSGDGHWEENNKRWRLGFTRNYNLERDLRTACARLGYHLILNLSNASFKGKNFPSFRGELRKERSGHFNQKEAGEVVSIGKAKCREVYDIGVEDEPHLYSLASGILTHNSKNNPMPESVKDRPTRNHEYVFLLTKNKKYYFDQDAVREPYTQPINRWAGNKLIATGKSNWDEGTGQKIYRDRNMRPNSLGRNIRSVWAINTKPYKGAHFSTFPLELPEKCIKAGSRENSIVLDPFNGAGTTCLVAKNLNRQYIGIDLNPEYCKLAENRIK